MLDLCSLSNGKDIYLARHHAGTAFYATGIALAAGLDAERISALQIAALVHDIGKIGVPLAILQKNGPLSSEEWLIIRQHTIVGAEIFLQKYRYMDRYAEEIVLAIKHHHERWDGTGYPDGLKGEQIPYLARILAIADSFDAMTGGRPYREPLDTAAAVKEIEKNMAIMYDPALAACAVRVLAKNNIFLKGDDKCVNFG
ncbi:metal dependent phosphohydrolase [Thermincola ferriacetica]|uniref:Metal dependent phosphohydrolase n=1 Tax=Thermincola ferriacetica TaxID=281456 RepID=A0A0L6W5I5_9FIRM|nr:HD domain-containing phosphohydrolase [Thermincola ferriacetica]KNZ70354.1 metal dependent phosphohydrolase [Thermincola ferriacetica]